MDVAPWKDFVGGDIFDGSTIAHPSGETGIVVFVSHKQAPADQWMVDYGMGVESRLCLQIGDKGQAIVI